MRKRCQQRGEPSAKGEWRRLSSSSAFQRTKRIIPLGSTSPRPRPWKARAGGLEAAPIGWQLFVLESGKSDSIVFLLLLATYATRLLAQALSPNCVIVYCIWHIP